MKLDLESAHAWSDFFQKNETLIHLDLSHNNIDSRELEVMSEGLTENHTILGLHLIGNEGDIDPQGFIKRHDPEGILQEEDITK